MKSFRQYLEETRSSREYHMRIKTVVPLDDDRMEAAERLLAKYDLLDLDGPHKTIFQSNPLDFWDIEKSEVWVLDVVTGIPVSSYILQQELVLALKVPEKYVVCRGDNDPLETESERLRALAKVQAEADKKGLERRALLDTDPNYSDAEQAAGPVPFGDDYNKGFLKHLASVAATRKSQEVVPSAPLFDFIPKKPEAGEDFNAGFDTVKPQPWWLADKADGFDAGTAPEGNFDDDCRKYSDRFTNPKTGKETEVSAASRSVRQSQKGKQK